MKELLLILMALCLLLVSSPAIADVIVLTNETGSPTTSGFTFTWSVNETATGTSYVFLTSDCTGAAYYTHTFSANDTSFIEVYNNLEGETTYSIKANGTSETPETTYNTDCLTQLTSTYAISGSARIIVLLFGIVMAGIGIFGAFDKIRDSEAIIVKLVFIIIGIIIITSLLAS